MQNLSVLLQKKWNYFLFLVQQHTIRSTIRQMCTRTTCINIWIFFSADNSATNSSHRFNTYLVPHSDVCKAQFQSAHNAKDSQRLYLNIYLASSHLYLVSQVMAFLFHSKVAPYFFCLFVLPPFTNWSHFRSLVVTLFTRLVFTPSDSKKNAFVYPRQLPISKPFHFAQLFPLTHDMILEWKWQYNQ